MTPKYESTGESIAYPAAYLRGVKPGLTAKPPHPSGVVTRNPLPLDPMFNLHRHLGLAVALLGSFGSLGAQTPLSGAPACAAPAYRQFDFWVGDWNVTVPAGGQAGTNDVTLEESGCVIHEHWKGAKGGTGQSFNFYDQSDQQWHQVWVDNQGSWLNLAGTYAGGKLTLTGQDRDATGKPEIQRLIFFNNPDGTVRQLWDASTDGGKTWTVQFDGLYQKR